jgi:uncharacterized protein YndB with AHSA1/START domain
MKRNNKYIFGKLKKSPPGKKIFYTWKYDYDPGVSLVTFELFPEGNRTRLELTHEGIHNFSKTIRNSVKKTLCKGGTRL